MMNFSFKTSLLFFLIINITSLGALAGPGNIAQLARVSSSTQQSDQFSKDMINDGIIRVDGQGEWACEGQTIFWGYIRYPWIQLDWSEEVSIDKIIIYDRPTPKEHSAGGTLTFSDGSEIKVTAIPNDGAPKLISFPRRKVKWLRFQVTDGDGFNLGLSEIEVFPSPEGYNDLVSWVNPFVETTRGRYFYFTPGSTPFGMIAAAPHTRNKNQWGGGYNYNSTEILGFGQVHGWMLSGISMMPTTGEINATDGEQGWKSSFSHDDELAQPGYQRVFLKDHGIWTEYTSTDRVSLYRLRYTDDGISNILVNLGGYLGSTTMTDAEVTKINDRSIEGSISSAGRLWGGPEKVKIFFVAEFDKPFVQLDGWNGEKQMEDITRLIGPSEMTRRDSMTFYGITQSYFDAPGAGVSAKFEVEAGDLLHMKFAISYVSIENARENMSAEMAHWDFDQVLTANQSKWNEWLGKIEVYGGSERQKIKFYTDLWHVLLGRHILNDINGEYPDYTQGKKNWKFTDAKLKVRELPRDENGEVKFNMYNSDALWLTQWNVNVLWGLGWPSILDDFSASMVQYADNGGLLPRGPNAGGYSYIMTGNPVTNMLVSAYQKGMLTKTDPDHAFEVMKRNHQPGGMMGDTPEELSFYIDKGWCPGNAGKTIEWTFQDWALAQMARKLNLNQDYEEFSRRSESWKNLYHKESKLIFPKDAEGNWMHTEGLSMEGWVEANAWQATWSISHDIKELTELIGGSDEISDMVDFAFNQAEKDDFVFGYGNGYVSYANQPGCSNAHVFNYTGKPWLSQYWVRKVNEQAYGDITPDAGYGGHDEDQGQMGGVSALMSIGIFSLRGNTSIDPVYEITSPVFDRIVIHLDENYYSGETFEIMANNNSTENQYIQSATLDGRELKGPWVFHRELADGGKLVIELGPEPNKTWGSNIEDAP